MVRLNDESALEIAQGETTSETGQAAQGAISEQGPNFQQVSVQSQQSLPPAQLTASPAQSLRATQATVIADPVATQPAHQRVAVQPGSKATQPSQSWQRRSPRMFRQLLWGTAFVSTALVSATVGAVLTLMAPLPGQPAASTPAASISTLVRQTFGFRVTRPVNILVMGIDRVLDAPEDSPAVFSGRSDTMLLVRVDPLQNTASILSIPRDTQVRIPGLGVSKINAANEYGGPELAAQVVSRSLDGVPIDRYVRISTDAFRELVDLLGGVEVYVPYPMSYTDNTQKLKIELEPGQQWLNGDQAEQFARFRHDAMGDVGRVQRQQTLIRALKERLLNPTVVTKIPEIIQLMQRYIDTNLTFEEMVALANFGLGLQREDFRMVMLPGRFSTPEESVASYWILDPEGRDRIMQEYFQVEGIFTTGQDLYGLRIAVQNTTENPAIARQVANYLRKQGFRHVYVIRPSDNPQDTTQIIVQRGDLQNASALQNLMGLGEVVPASTGALESDLTLRIGSDWIHRTRG